MIKPFILIRCLGVTVATISLLAACKPPVVFTDSADVRERAKEIEDPEARQVALNKYIPCDIPSLQTSNSVSDSLAINIYVDGSDSMQGYVRPPETEYKTILKSIDSIFSSSNPSYYRVGVKANNTEYEDGLSKSLNRQQFRKAQNLEFYGSNDQLFPRITSSLDKAITAPQGGDQLLVIVTDLEQNEGDVTNITNQIKTKYLAQETKDYAIGILGINSQFDGQVTPVNRQYSPFSYQGTRPFYVILIGPYQQVVSYHRQIAQDNSRLVSDDNFSLFYPQGIVERSSHFDGKTKLPDDFYRPQSLNDGKVAVEVEVPPYDLIEIPSRLNQEIYEMSYAFPLSWLDFVPKPSLSSIQPRHRVKIYDPSQKKFVEQNDDTLKNAITFERLNLTGNKLEFDAIVNPENFDAESSIYLLTIDFTFDDIQDERWWQDWDWSSRDNSKDGSKTYGVLNFMGNLKRETMVLMANGQESNIIGRFCYGIQKN